MTNAYRAAIQALEAAIPTLPEHQRSFARSLIEQSERGLSEKQWVWVRRLAEPKTEAPTANLRGILELFASVPGEKAILVVRTKDGSQYRLSRAGTKSTHPGTLNVTDNKRGFDRRTWFGRITLDGTFEPAYRLSHAEARAVVEALETFQADPAGVAGQFGLSTGVCCFCAAELTDPRSKEVGYGPVCAAKWHLSAAWKAAGKTPLRAEAV
jgi:hypothetical protein